MNAIVFSNFSKKYGNFTAVENMNLSVEKGTITGFVGKNGAGKSTTIRALMNILFPTGGKIEVNNLDSVKQAKKIKGQVSYMPSDAMFNENITSKELFKLCSEFQGSDYDYAIELADYFELDVNKKISSLSLGNRKKVSIIQALMKNSQIFVLDEPTSGLDPLMQDRFFEKLQERKEQGATVFLSSHNLSEIEKYCDKSIIIKDGKIIDTIDMNEAQKRRKQIVSYVTLDGDKKSYTYEGDINELILELSKLNLKSVEIRQASIEEEFIKYYEDDQKESSENE